jgi:hypothetical protein
LALRDPEEHARRRRAWNRAFSTPALKDYEVLIEARISQLVDILNTKTTSGKSVDLSKWLGWLTYVINSFAAYHPHVHLRYDIMNCVMFARNVRNKTSD